MKLLSSVFLSCALIFLAPQLAHAQNCFKAKDINECVNRRDKEALGKYLCIVHHMAGIQGTEGTRRPSAIRPSPDRFFAEISEDSSIPCALFIGVLPADPMSTAVCQSRYKLAMRPDTLITPGSVYSAGAPYDFFNATSRVTFSSDGKFQGSFRRENSYIYEGQCEKISG
jgi:hypothetical protein